MMKSVLIWLSYEFFRPKAIWLFHYLVKLGEKQPPKHIEKKKIIPKTYEKIISQETNARNPDLKAANILAKNIRNKEERWGDALKRAHGQIKLLRDLETKKQSRDKNGKPYKRKALKMI